MSKYSNLWMEIGDSLCEFHKVTYSSFLSQESSNGFPIRLKAYYLLLLEIMIHEHRQKYANPYAPIVGIDALRHKVMQKTKWHLDYIESLSLDQVFLVLLEDLHPDNLSVESRAALSVLKLPAVYEKAQLPLEGGWNLGKGERFLKNDG